MVYAEYDKDFYITHCVCGAPLRFDEDEKVLYCNECGYRENVEGEK